jgi:hypothetical protein
VHHFEGKPLVHEFIANTMMGIEFLWGKPVMLETSEVACQEKQSPDSLQVPGREPGRTQDCMAQGGLHHGRTANSASARCKKKKPEDEKNHVQVSMAMQNLDRIISDRHQNLPFFSKHFWRPWWKDRIRY